MFCNRCAVGAGHARPCTDWQTQHCGKPRAALSTADCARVLNATAPDSMQVAYFFGGTRTAKMYAGDRTADLKAAREGRAVWEVAVNLIEY